jgi:hypothetical protein
MQTIEHHDDHVHVFAQFLVLIQGKIAQITGNAHGVFPLFGRPPCNANEVSILGSAESVASLHEVGWHGGGGTLDLRNKPIFLLGGKRAEKR